MAEQSLAQTLRGVLGSRISDAQGFSSSDGCVNCGGFLSQAEAPGRDAHRCCACGDAGFVRYQVDREDPRFGKAIPCPDCAARTETESLEREIFRLRIPRKFIPSTLDNWRPHNDRKREACEEYVATWPPAKPFLLLTGEKGRGKTHLACGILRAVYERHGQRGAFWPVIDLLDRYKATFDDATATETTAAIDAEMRRMAVIVLDDFGAESATGFAMERVFRLVDERYRELRPLVITTNLDLMTLDGRVTRRFNDASGSRMVQFQ